MQAKCFQIKCSSKPGQERRLDLRPALKSCLSFGFWSAPDYLLKILLWMWLIYLKTWETLVFLRVSLSSNSHLASLLQSDPLASITKQCFHLLLLIISANLVYKSRYEDFLSENPCLKHIFSSR